MRNIFRLKEKVHMYYFIFKTGWCTSFGKWHTT
jgi:hypothetical protein